MLAFFGLSIQEVKLLGIAGLTAIVISVVAIFLVFGIRASMGSWPNSDVTDSTANLAKVRSECGKGQFARFVCPSRFKYRVVHRAIRTVRGLLTTSIAASSRGQSLPPLPFDC